MSDSLTWSTLYVSVLLCACARVCVCERTPTHLACVVFHSEGRTLVYGWGVSIAVLGCQGDAVCGCVVEVCL